jgi:hypothetical protein
MGSSLPKYFLANDCDKTILKGSFNNEESSPAISLTEKTRKKSSEA